MATFGHFTNMKFTILVFLFLSACDLDTKKTGMHKNSQSIEESKSNGVFIQTLKVNKSSINMGDNKKDTIKQIWIENGWTYESKNFFSSIIQKDSFQQVLILFGGLSNSWNDTILLEYNDGYFGWNRVFFSTYKSNKDTVFIIKKIDNKETNLDTLIMTR